MEIVNIGVGEAFDETLPNNSHLIISDDMGTRLLLDCGYSVPNSLWEYSADPELIDAVFISHEHADHYFGIPALLVRMREDGRKKPLTIISHSDVIPNIKYLLDMGYPGTEDALEFSLHFLKAQEGRDLRFKDLILSFALTEHSITNMAIRIKQGMKSVCYSGDGRFTDESVEMYRSCNVLIHEAYFYNKPLSGHGTVKDVAKMAKKAGVKHLMFTHIQRDCRKKKIENIRKYGSNLGIKATVPEPGDVTKL